MVKRLVAVISYDGSAFKGYQIQPDSFTIQGEIEKVLKRILQCDVKIYASGRTDRGVHALGQIIHFDVDVEVDAYKLLASVNALLPPSIRFLNIYETSPNFHSRFGAIRKHYRYVICNDNVLLPFENNYSLLIKDYVNEIEINKILHIFIGKHNFKNFTSKEEDEDNYLRTIQNITVKRIDNHIYIDFYGDGFMRYMIRMILGTTLAVYFAKEDLNYIKSRLDSEVDEVTSYNISPSGLYLVEVTY